MALDVNKMTKDQLKQHILMLAMQLTQLEKENKTLKEDNDKLQTGPFKYSYIKKIKYENEKLKEKNKRLEQENKRISKQRDNLSGVCDRVIEENDYLEQENKKLKAERDKYYAEYHLRHS